MLQKKSCGKEWLHLLGTKGNLLHLIRLCHTCGAREKVTESCHILSCLCNWHVLLTPHFCAAEGNRSANFALRRSASTMQTEICWVSSNFDMHVIMERPVNTALRLNSAMPKQTVTHNLHPDDPQLPCNEEFAWTCQTL